jgi:isopentenyl-diphosphate delta-isomerase
MGAAMHEQVILVDEADRELGVLEKLAAHQNGGVLHRAVSVLLFDETSRLLLQQRAAEKYHCGGLWSNTCCTHPRPGEAPHAAARRRLREELGIAAPLRFAFSFIYRHTFDNGLTEHELDHVFWGRVASETPAPFDPSEVAAVRWVSRAELDAELAHAPERFTYWFRAGLLPRIWDLPRHSVEDQGIGSLG